MADTRRAAPLAYTHAQSRSSPTSRVMTGTVYAPAGTPYVVSSSRTRACAVSRQVPTGRGCAQPDPRSSIRPVIHVREGRDRANGHTASRRPSSPARPVYVHGESSVASHTKHGLLTSPTIQRGIGNTLHHGATWLAVSIPNERHHSTVVPSLFEAVRERAAHVRRVAVLTTIPVRGCARQPRREPVRRNSIRRRARGWTGGDGAEGRNSVGRFAELDMSSRRRSGSYTSARPVRRNSICRVIDVRGPARSATTIVGRINVSRFCELNLARAPVNRHRGPVRRVVSSIMATTAVFKAMSGGPCG